jgi:DHA1 family bicyclomycin/chloramphenicol resistance-like MFS transporter
MAGRFTERFGVARMILAGSALAFVSVSALLLIFALGFSGPAALFLPMGVAGMANGIALPSAVSGAISVRPDIAGAASGLSGAAQLGTGAVLSILGSAALAGGTSALPMLLIMTAAAALALGVAGIILRRDR